MGEALDRLLGDGAGPKSITVDHGAESQSLALEGWVCRRNLKLDFIRLGTPVENALIESFNGHLRDERLRGHQFESLEVARRRIEAWRRNHNRHRPHGSLGHLTPDEFAHRRQAERSAESVACAN